MAVPMDETVSGAPEVVPDRARHGPATPPHAPLEMPTQDLDRRPVAAFGWARPRTLMARLSIVLGVIGLVVYGSVEMQRVFGNETQTHLQGLLLVLFTITFGWISISACQAMAGCLFGPPARPVGGDAPLRSLTAIVMPVYNEDPVTTGGALLAMGEMLAEAGHGHDFEIFILSDTRDLDVYVRETATFATLRERLGDRMAVWYRRRPRNTGRKAGNLREFVERWGARYDHMLVLDADSLMDAETVVEMVRRMKAEPRLGILQSVPRLCGGASLFARLQQFASGLHGPAIARGVAAWQGVDGNYWGHNALIRVSAFAESCGLPELPGRMPFGGHVLSHDFVEAALIRRRGWQVRMDPDLHGSWEGSPPSLLTLAARDRRWAQGNLQHVKLLGTAGLRAPNRMHFLVGIGAYLMSPIWLAMILTGFALTVQTLIVDPQYFDETQQLFPDWPVFDAERMLGLFTLSMALLLLPKVIGLGHALISPSRRQSFGGGAAVSASAALELLLSALYAPILMLMQASQVLEILRGRDSGWSAQARGGAALPWRAAAARHLHHVAAGVVPMAALAYLAPDQLIWIAPVAIGLVASPVLSRMSGDDRVGAALARAGLLTIPEEWRRPRALCRAERARALFARAADFNAERLTTDAELRARHVATLPTEPPAETGRARERLDRITARAKIEAAGSPEEALDWMTDGERDALLSSRRLLARLARLRDRGLAFAPDRAAGR